MLLRFEIKNLGELPLLPEDSEREQKENRRKIVNDGLRAISDRFFFFIHYSFRDSRKYFNSKYVFNERNKILLL